MIRNRWGYQSARDRRAFTLVELLVVIVVITLMSSISLFALYGVREDARERRARAQVAKINELIMQQWEAYRTRALPLRIAPGTDPRVAARLRLDALRELMRMELPDRMTDLYIRDGSGNWVSPTSVADPTMFFGSTPVVLDSPPSAWLGFQRRIIANALRGNTWTVTHEHSECLYMILAGMRDGDTTGLEWFLESEIGDVDGDGMPEILDPWGRPIYFLRWAPGFPSALQDPARPEPDPFDPLRADPRWDPQSFSGGGTLPQPFALFPLIYSAGRDGGYGIIIREDPEPSPGIAGAPTYPFYQSSHLFPYCEALFPALRPMNDPYFVLPLSGQRVGLPVENTADDNITNHLLEVR